jgi:hypothetical protein
MRNWRIAAVIAVAFYLWSVHAIMGIRGEHLFLAGLTVVFAVIGGKPFRFTALFSPVILTGITYEYFRLLKGIRLDIHVADLYHAELHWFGVGQGESRQVLANWFLAHTHPALDLICGLAYILYLFVPIVFAIVLFFVDEERMLHVGLAFLITNLVGMAIYVLYPAAPPWYVAEYGLGPARLDVLPNAAGTVRFDHLLGIDYFTTFYARSANVFGAMPSLHVGYPMSTAIALGALGKRWWMPVIGFVIVVGFAAIYLQHHYVWDVVVGIAVGALGGWVAGRVTGRWSPSSKRTKQVDSSQTQEAALA